MVWVRRRRANATHQEKKLSDEALSAFRSRFEIPIPEEAAHEGALYRPADDSPEIAYLQERRRELGGYMRSRSTAHQIEAPQLEYYAESLTGSKGRAVSHTMALWHSAASAEGSEDRQADRADHPR